VSDPTPDASPRGPAGTTPPGGSQPAAAAGGASHRSPQLLTILGPDDRAVKREKVVDVLWELQQKRGWIDDEAVKIAARECDLTPIEVDEVATFYNLLLRAPAGRTTIFVCDSISCELCGSKALTERLTEVLGIQVGEVTKDGEFGLLPIVCLGHCEMAPCLMAGETVHGPLTTDRASVESLLQRIRDGRSPSQSQG
jgi:NADH-quinone oxidoreductase subunit E